MRGSRRTLMIRLRRRDVTTASDKTATITRSKLYPVPGKAARYAWKWIYAAHDESGADLNLDQELGTLTWQLKRQGYTIVRAW